MPVKVQVPELTEIEAIDDPDSPSEIIPGFLWLGSFSNASNYTFLRSHNIRYILNCADECDNVFSENRTSVSGREFIYHNLHLYDMGNGEVLPYENALSFLTTVKGTGKAVLIHCLAGVSRSASIVLMYLMIEYKLTLKQAFDKVRALRPIINPNPGYFYQLQHLDKELHGSVSLEYTELMVHELLVLGYEENNIFHALRTSNNVFPLALKILQSQHFAKH